MSRASSYYPLHVMPYTPECRLAGGKQDPAFQTKPQIALALVERALAADIAFKAIVADCFYGDNNALEAALRQRGLPYVLAHRGTVGRGWAPAEMAQRTLHLDKITLSAVEPPVLERKRDCLIVAARARGKSFRPAQPCRPVACQRQRERQPVASVLLSILLGNAVQFRLAAGIDAGIRSEP